MSKNEQRGRGRPSKYKKELVGQVYDLAKLGATEAAIANFFKIGLSTFEDWKRKYEDFNNALKRGKEISDSEVQQSLRKRALGYEYTEVKTEGVVTEGGKVVGKKVTRTVKQVAPDTAAAFIWLKNRQSKHWKDRPIDDDAADDVATLLKKFAGMLES